MGKTLIITDSRETAEIFVRVLMDRSRIIRETGFIEDENYILFCTDGDIMEVCAIDEYVPGEIKIDHLPILPDRIRYKVKPEKETHLKEIRYLFTRTDIRKIIIATESTHIGEVRAITIFLSCGMDPYSENVFRLWSSKPVSPESIEDEIDNAKPAYAFKSIYETSHAQTFTDWLFAENISKALSLALDSKQRITRPQAYVLILLAENRLERSLFRSTQYWIVKVSFASSQGVMPWVAEYRDEKFEKGDAAEKFGKSINGESGKIVIQKKKERKKLPPKLFNLTDLQAEGQNRYNLNADETLTAALTCHNQLRCITSPHTNTNYLPEREIITLKRALTRLKSTYGDFFSQIDPRLITSGNKKLFTNKNLDRHHAIIPIAPLPDGAGENETAVYGLILRRFAASVSLPTKYDDIETEITVKGKKFICSESVVTKPGWQFVYGKTKDEQCTPVLKEGSQVNVVDTEVRERRTTPPPELTDGSLIRILARPARKIKDIKNDVFTIRPQDINISTKSVRGQIIEELIAEGYVQRNKKRLSLTEKGLFIVDIISRLPLTSHLLSHKEVARWEMRLGNIANGTFSKVQFVDEVKKLIFEAIKEYKPGTFEKLTSKKLNAKCPLCDGDVYERNEFYGCSNWKDPNNCKFRIWRKYGGRVIDKKCAEQLIANKKTGIIDGFISKGLKKKEFSARLLLKINENKSANISFEFPKESATSQVGTCPDCTGTVYEYATRYACENYMTGNGCKFQMWKTIKSKTIDLRQARQLLSDGKTGKLFGFVSHKRGTPRQFSASLAIQKGAPSRVVFVFGGM